LLALLGAHHILHVSRIRVKPILMVKGVFVLNAAYAMAVLDLISSVHLA
jgi:hypothetical protein